LLRASPGWGLPDVRPLLGSVPSLRRSRRRVHGHAFCCCLTVLPAHRTGRCVLQTRRGSVSAARISLKAIERILQLRRGLPLRRTWIEQPYGEEEITLLEEEVIPAIQQCLKRVDELDERLLAQQELLHRCQLEAEREVLGDLRLQMA